MMLTAYKGEQGIVNNKLLLKAFDTTPSLVLDCGNCADPHALFPRIKEEQLHDVYVVNLEAIYRFRKGLMETPGWIRQLKLKQVIITTIHILYSYDDPHENNNIIGHCWELMKDISKICSVHVGIGRDRMHMRFAKTFSDKIEVV